MGVEMYEELAGLGPESICACIPARYASSRLHGKLLYGIGGQSVLERTCRRALECKWISRVFILTDHEHVSDAMNEIDFGEERVEVILKKVMTRNGTERIGKNLENIPEQFRIIVNIQGDEPFVDPRNVDYVIERHIEAHKENGLAPEIFFSTLHQRIEDLDYLQETSCVKIIVNRKNNAMLFTRNVVPWNKDGVVRSSTHYYSCTGLYVYNRERIQHYNALPDTEHQIEEDVEQLKVLEHGYIIKTWECPYFNEISVNTNADYNLLRIKYNITDDCAQQSGRSSPLSSLSGSGSESGPFESVAAAQEELS